MLICTVVLYNCYWLNIHFIIKFEKKITSLTTYKYLIFFFLRLTCCIRNKHPVSGRTLQTKSTPRLRTVICWTLKVLSQVGFEVTTFEAVGTGVATWWLYLLIWVILTLSATSVYKCSYQYFYLMVKEATEIGIPIFVWWISVIDSLN